MASLFHIDVYWIILPSGIATFIVLERKNIFDFFPHGNEIACCDIVSYSIMLNDVVEESSIMYWHLQLFMAIHHVISCKYYWCWWGSEHTGNNHM